MMDQTSWSMSLGRWLGVNVRLHMTVVLFMLFVMAFAWTGSNLAPGLSGMSLALIAGGAWLSAVLVHEFGHRFVAYQLGCDVRGTLIMPWGGMADLPPLEGWGRVAIYGAGPAANALATLIGAFVSVALLDSAVTMSLFDPLRPDRLLESPSRLENGLRVAIWMNAMFCLINLVPVMVLDGGHVLLGLIQVFAPPGAVVDRIWLVRLVGVSTGIAAVTLAVSIGLKSDGALMQGWFYLLLFGITVIFAARSGPTELDAYPQWSQGRIAHNLGTLTRGSDRRELSEFEQAIARLGGEVRGNDDADDEDYDLDADDEEQDEESLSTWLRERRSERAEQARQRELDEERRADEILDKVHRLGIQSLTSGDRELLERVSVRYRNRQREQA